MRKLIIAAALVVSTLTSLPACSATTPKSERKQETIELGNSRFLIFVSEPNAAQFATTADLVVIDKGVPHFDPLFTQEYDVDTHNLSLSEGIAFQAQSYHFDKITNTLDYTTMDAENHVRYQFKLHLDTDMFTLREVVMQKDVGNQTTIPKVIYRNYK